MAKKKKDPIAVELGRRGGKARAKKLTKQQARDLAKKLASARWAKSKEAKRG